MSAQAAGYAMRVDRRGNIHGTARIVHRLGHDGVAAPL